MSQSTNMQMNPTQRKQAKIREILRIIEDVNDDSIIWINSNKIRFNWNTVREKREFYSFSPFHIVLNCFVFVCVFVLKMDFPQIAKIFFTILEVCDIDLFFGH